ncbi:MAG: UDP-N-acetylmuramoyl-tripeptide--D-alanyl-D-alanine ligase [Candidatus Latescibacterota bacterium]
MKIETLHQHFLQSTGICTDTRKITKDCLFFALKGDNFNGNKFVQEALDKGAFKAVIDQIGYHKNTGETILCGNGLKSLQNLAAYHRKHLGLPIVALTGSNGKTTTKELINAVLAKKFRTGATIGNLNNHIGVPLTILSMDSTTEMGIVEMGANHIGEIHHLTEIAQPDFGYITNFGKAHLEGFGSIQGVIQGKSELYKHLKQKDKLVFVNANDPTQMELTASISRITFGLAKSDCYVGLKDASNTLLVNFKGIDIQSNLIGLYNFHNIAAAIAIGDYHNIPAEKIKVAIEGYVPSNNRSQRIELHGHKIILDAYNANPSSMMAALENFKQAEGDQKVLFLGDMFELGEVAADEHQQIVDWLAKNAIGTVYLVGSNFFGLKMNAPHIQKFESFDNLKDHLTSEKIQPSLMLIKGSRGMALERILELI